MKKLTLLGIIIFIVGLSIAIAVMIEKQNKKEHFIQQLPDLEIMAMDSSVIQIAVVENMQIMILYFHPECEFCSMEISTLLANKDKFSNTIIYFVSSASINEIKTYIKIFPICSFKNVIIGSDYEGEVAIKLHVTAPPSCYIYDSKGRLKKYFKGVCPISKLLKYI